jgi:hypothetical protein
MELIADKCSKTIEANVKEDEVVVGSIKEQTLLNDYFNPKNIETQIYKLDTNKHYMEVIKAGESLQEYQKKINSVLKLDQLFNSLNQGGPAPTKRPDTRVNKGNQEKQIVESLVTSFGDKMYTAEIKKLYANGGEPTKPALDAVAKKVYDLVKQKEADAAVDVQFDTDALPSLKKLYEILHDEGQVKKIIAHLTNLYVEKNSIDYVESILDLIETDFPIHLERNNLKNELDLLQKKDPWTRIETDAKANWKKEYTRRVGVNLVNPNLVELKALKPAAGASPSLKYKTLKSDILWEDFGFFE